MEPMGWYTTELEGEDAAAGPIPVEAAPPEAAGAGADALPQEGRSMFARQPSEGKRRSHLPLERQPYVAFAGISLVMTPAEEKYEAITDGQSLSAWHIPSSYAHSVPPGLVM